MSNYDTVRAVTANIQETLKKEGIHFSKKAFTDEKNIPVSVLPLGRISYLGETFSNSYGQRPEYVEAEFGISVQLKAKDPDDALEGQQRWGHRIRDVLSTDNLNTGALAAIKPVSRVRVDRIEAEHTQNYSTVSCRAVVRYREA